jgi:signal transduction histidine kinase
MGGRRKEEQVQFNEELHDGIVQVLVSSKFFLETAQLQFWKTGGLQPSATGQTRSSRPGTRRQACSRSGTWSAARAGR